MVTVTKVMTAAGADTVMNAREAAAYLGATYWQVWHWLNTGRLEGKRGDGRDWAVKMGELERFKRAHLAALKDRVAGAVALRLRADVLAAIWKDEMHTAQTTAAFEAEQFAKQYRALVAAARRGAIDPDLAEAFGERSETVIAALLRFQAANRLYAKVAVADEQAAKAEWKVAEEVKADDSTGNGPSGNP